MRFTKMHGAGNDYVYVNCFEEQVDDPAALAVAMSRQHYGVGSDGLILICPSNVADFEMKMYNSDGSESEMCGNATRCIAKYVYERGLTDKTDIMLMTGAGLKELKLSVRGGKVESVRVDMGMPVFMPEAIPVNMQGETIINEPLNAGGVTYSVTCVSMGNPHCVVFVRDPYEVDIESIGPMLENHPAFPHRTNVEFVTVKERDDIRMRVWERGSCETLACGTGACAALVASVLTGKAGREACVHLPGGNVQVTWSAEDNHVYQEGGANFVFDGEWPDEDE